MRTVALPVAVYRYRFARARRITRRDTRRLACPSAYLVRMYPDASRRRICHIARSRDPRVRILSQPGLGWAGLGALRGSGPMKDSFSPSPDERRGRQREEHHHPAMLAMLA